MRNGKKTDKKRVPKAISQWTVLMLLTAVLVGQHAAASNQEDVQIASAAEAYVAAQVAANDFTGAVLVSQGGRPLFRRAYGMSDLEHQVPNMPETKFRIGSISKQFAAALVGILQQEGMLDVGDTLGLYFDDIPDTWTGIRLYDLLTHRSGILDLEDIEGYRESMALPTQPRETMKRFYEVPLRFTPGTRFEYSSSGYVILAAVIETVTDRSFEDLLREKVLDPLALHDTGHDQHAPILAHRARGYAWGVGGLENAPYIHMDLPIGGGELYSTADDLARWARALEHGELLKGDALEALFTPEPVKDPRARRSLARLFGVDVESGGYANGWAIGTQHDRFCRQHGGAINGFAAYLARFPEEDATVVVLSNAEAYLSIVEIGVDLAAILFGEDYSIPDPSPDILPSAEVLESYTGCFELKPGLNLTITRNGEQLLAQVADDPVEPIFPRSETDFYFKTNSLEISFQPGDAGQVDEVILNVGGGREVMGARVR